MSILAAVRQKIKERQGKSFALLAERVDKSAVAPYCINTAENVSSEETMVLILGGAGGRGVHLRGYNGYLKKTDDFIKTHPELSGKNVRVCVAVCYIGRFHNERLAREKLYHEYWQEKYSLDMMAKEQREEILNPCYIKDIFEQVFLPRISRNGGKERLPAEQAARNIRRLNIVAHCHGAYVALRLEQMMLQKMAELGYLPAERKKVVRQLMVLNYAPDCPVRMAESLFVSIESAADEHNKYQTRFKEYLQMKALDFGMLRLPERGGNVLMCTKVDKSGIEGNPPKVIILEKVDPEIFFFAAAKRLHNPDNKENAENDKENLQRDKGNTQKEKVLGEHEFLGFKKASNMSKGAQELRLFANNILKNAVLNSLCQNDASAKALPTVKTLACDTSKQYAAFSRAYLKGWQLHTRCVFTNQQKLKSFIWHHQTCRIELDG